MIVLDTTVSHDLTMARTRATPPSLPYDGSATWRGEASRVLTETVWPVIMELQEE